MTTHKHLSLQSPTTVLNSELNSLASAALSSASAAYDNSSGLYIFCGVEYTIAAQGSARAAGAALALFHSVSLTGTAQDLTVESPLFDSQTLDAATTARIHSRYGMWIPPSATIKYALQNNTGQAFASSGNTVKIVVWYTQSV